MPTRISAPAGGVNRFAGRQVRLDAKIVLEQGAFPFRVGKPAEMPAWLAAGHQGQPGLTPADRARPNR